MDVVIKLAKEKIEICYKVHPMEQLSLNTLLNVIKTSRKLKLINVVNALFLTFNPRRFPVSSQWKIQNQLGMSPHSISQSTLTNCYAELNME